MFELLKIAYLLALFVVFVIGIARQPNRKMKQTPRPTIQIPAEIATSTFRAPLKPISYRILQAVGQRTPPRPAGQQKPRMRQRAMSI